MKISELTKNEQLKLVYDMFEPSLTYTPFTQLANLTGQPAISVPVHLTKNGLPLGGSIYGSKRKRALVIQNCR